MMPESLWVSILANLVAEMVPSVVSLVVIVEIAANMSPTVGLDLVSRCILPASDSIAHLGP